MYGPALTAQNGPGSVGRTDGNTNLELWMQAGHDTAVHYDANGNVTGVSDLSGNERHVNKIYSKPKFRTNRINGLPAFEFDGQNDILVIEGFNVSPGKIPDISIFIVFDSDEDKFDNTQTAKNDSIRAKLYGNDNHGWDRTAGFEERGHPSISRGGGNWRYFRGEEYCKKTGNACTPRPMFNITRDSFYIFTSMHIEKEQKYYGYMNGRHIAEDDVDHNDGTDNFCIGALSDNSENTHNTYAKQQWWDGDIAEFILFGKKVNTVERRLIENYLSAKYGIALYEKENDYFSEPSARFTTHIGGIGRETDGIHGDAESGGLIISGDTSSNGFLQNAGDYIMVGKDTMTHGLSKNDLPFTSGNRWAESWYFDVTDNGPDSGGQVTFTFDFGLAGSKSIPQIAANYKLLYRNGNSGTFEALNAKATISNDSVIFTLTVGTDSNKVRDGYYTLGSLEKGYTTQQDNYSPDLNVYPVPFRDHITVDLRNVPGPVQWFLTDPCGRILKHGISLQDAKTLSISNLNTLKRGVYFLQLSDKLNHSTRRLFKY